MSCLSLGCLEPSLSLARTDNGRSTRPLGPALRGLDIYTHPPIYIGLYTVPAQALPRRLSGLSPPTSPRDDNGRPRRNAHRRPAGMLRRPETKNDVPPRPNMANPPALMIIFRMRERAGPCWPPPPLFSPHRFLVGGAFCGIRPVFLRVCVCVFCVRVCESLSWVFCLASLVGVAGPGSWISRTRQR